MLFLLQALKGNAGKKIKIIFLFACTFFLAFLTSANAAILTYPGPATPCNTTLQHCIDSSSAGDVIEIATSSPIDESPKLDHSLTLRPAAGFTPMLSASNLISASSAGTADNDFTITIQGITLEDGVMVGPYTYITDGDHGTENDKGVWERPMHLAPVLIREGAWIGAHCCILRGVTIGRYAIVGAGAVVTQDVPDNEKVAGVPAKLLETFQTTGTGMERKCFLR